MVTASQFKPWLEQMHWADEEPDGPYSNLYVVVASLTSAS
jgi:hypothetical protein